MTALPAPPPCPQCAYPTEPFAACGEDIWRCPRCGRRTYGTGDPDDDDQLPAFSETDAEGRLVCYLGTGDIDVEATAELAAQDAPDDEDDEDRHQAAHTLAPAHYQP
ncbi:hypothetical protein ABT173_22585 [Streptomyces sp. NPDC001795]|uniref:hypothetical protein n=1 Tax=Streptomyces sp. NPDC001795 TaxID=3154525 RepID=UPI003331A613